MKSVGVGLVDQQSFGEAVQARFNGLTASGIRPVLVHDSMETSSQVVVVCPVLVLVAILLVVVLLLRHRVVGGDLVEKGALGCAGRLQSGCMLLSGSSCSDLHVLVRVFKLHFGVQGAIMLISASSLSPSARLVKKRGTILLLRNFSGRCSNTR